MIIKFTDSLNARLVNMMNKGVNHAEDHKTRLENAHDGIDEKMFSVCMIVIDDIS